MDFRQWSEEELVEFINKAENILKEKRKRRRIEEKKNRIKRKCAECRDRINGLTVKQLARKYDMSTSAVRSDTEKVLRIIKYNINNEYDIDGSKIETGKAGFDYLHKDEKMRKKVLECINLYEKKKLESISN